MQTVADIYALWPSVADLARDLGVTYPTVSAWKQRGSIPPHYWRAMVGAAQRRGQRKLTLEVLADVHAIRPSVKVAGLAEEEASNFVASAEGGDTGQQQGQ